MLRVAASGLARGLRGISSSAARLDEAAAPAGPKEFAEAWAKVAPSTLSMPELPSSFLEPAAPAADAGADGDRFQVNFYTPTGIVAEAKVRVCVCVCAVREDGALEPRSLTLARGVRSERRLLSHL
jgi:hypothetical protein